MKKTALLVLIILLMTTICYADEQTHKQTQEAKDIKGAIVIKKQPTQENAMQVQRVEKVYGSIVIFVQGKTPFDKTDNKEQKN